MNLIVNYIWGDKYTFSLSHQLYLESLCKIDCYKLIIVHDMSQKNIDRLKDIYDRVVVVEKPKFHFSYPLEIYNAILNNCMHCEYMLFADSFDVVIQSDPFEHITNSGYDICLTSPGFRVKDQWPDRNWHEYFNKTLGQEVSFLEDKVLNGAFVAGKTKKVLDFYIFLVSNLNRNGSHVVDQTVFLYYYHLMKDRNTVKIFDSREDNFIYHCQNEYFFNREEKPKVIDGQIYSSANELYCIWHQWDDIGYKAALRENGEVYIK